MSTRGLTKFITRQHSGYLVDTFRSGHNSGSRAGLAVGNLLADDYLTVGESGNLSQVRDH